MPSHDTPDEVEKRHRLLDSVTGAHEDFSPQRSDISRQQCRLAGAVNALRPDARFEDLPACISQYFTPEQFAWLSDHEKASLLREETEPEGEP